MALPSIDPDILRDLVSAPRFARYERQAGDAERAAALYEWNIQVGGALLEVMAPVEVVVRNAFDRQLRIQHSARKLADEWYDAAWLSVEGQRDIQEAKRRAAKGRHATHPSHGKVIAELSFGFWRYLTSRRYQATAWPALLDAFSQAQHFPPRAGIERSMRRMNELRNRIAHHEPLFARDLEADHATMLEFVGWISRDARDWVSGFSRVGAVLLQRPVGS